MGKEKSLSKDFTKGNVAQQLLWFALPFMASNALQVLYSTIDMIIVGKYVGTAVLRGMSDSKRPLLFIAIASVVNLVLAMLDGVVLRIGLSWLFGIALGWGFYGFVLGYGLAPNGFAVPSMIYFLSGIWKKRKTLADEL